MINKTSFTALAAALLAASTCGPAMAQSATPSLTLFGNIDTQFENVRTSGSANPALDKPARWRVSAISSDLGVKGSVSLGENLTGMFQYVTGVSSDSANGNTSSGMWANAKDVFVGLRAKGVGSLKIGRMTGAARWNSGTADFSPAGAGLQDVQGALSGAGGQTAAGPLFNVRLDNAVGIETDSFSGFSARAYYSANENKSNAAVSSGARLSDSSYSLGLQYVNGPFDVRLSHEVRLDKGTLNNSTSNDTTDTDTRFGLRYSFPTNTILALGYDRMSFKDNTAVGALKRSLRKSGWVVSARQVIGPHTIYGGVGKAGDLRCAMADASVCDGSSTGMGNWVLAYNYAYNSSMLIEAFVTQLRNESRARYDFDSGSVGMATGANATAFGTGLRYSF
jgi:predicted porin